MGWAGRAKISARATGTSSNTAPYAPDLSRGTVVSTLDLIIHDTPSHQKRRGRHDIDLRRKHAHGTAQIRRGRVYSEYLSRARRDFRPTTHHP